MDQVNNHKKPFRTNQEKMNYAKRISGILSGYTLASDHSILICEHYKEIDIPTIINLQKFYIGGRVDIISEPWDTDDIDNTMWIPIKKKSGNMLPKKDK